MAQKDRYIKVQPGKEPPKGSTPLNKDVPGANPNYWTNEKGDRVIGGGEMVPDGKGGYVERAGLTQNFDASGFQGYGKTYNITAAQAEEHQRQVAEQEMSAYWLDQMLGDVNSPLMRRGSATGQAMAGQRGLMNSSLAAGAAHGAMIDRAQPFALSDADAYRGAASQNLDVRMKTALENAGLMTSARMKGAELTGAMDRTAFTAEAEALMQEQQRRWQSGETRNQNAWQTGERTGAQDWQSAENLLNRDWQTGERLGTEDFTGAENQLNRDWTSEENMHQRMQDWATVQLQTYAQMNITDTQAMAQVMANIYSNPNLTASEQNAAWANAQISFKGLYGRPWEPPPGFPQFGSGPQDADFGQTGQPPVTPLGPGTGQSDPNMGPNQPGQGQGQAPNPYGPYGQYSPYNYSNNPLMPWYQPSYTGGLKYSSIYSPGVEAEMDGLPDV